MSKSPRVPVWGHWRLRVSDILQQQNATGCRIPRKPPHELTPSTPGPRAGEKSTPRIPLHRAEDNARDLCLRHIVEIISLLLLFLISLQAFRQLPAQRSGPSVQLARPRPLGCPANARHGTRRMVSPDEQAVLPPPPRTAR